MNKIERIERPIHELRYRSKGIALEVINRLILRAETCNRNSPYYFDRAAKYLEIALYEQQISNEEYDYNRKIITDAINKFSERCNCTEKSKP